MSYGHADKIAGRVGGDPAPGAEKPVPAIDPALYERDEVRRILAVRDIGALYRVLNGEGVSQHRIARLTDQSQSEVSEILKGRQVMAYDVLVRIAEGLGIPREYMGLGYGPHGEDGAYRGEVTVTEPEKVDEMLRRHFEHLLALAATSAVGSPVTGVGELVAWLSAPALPPDTQSHIGAADVEMIRRCGEQVGALARACGGQGQASVRLVAWAEQWLDATCTETVRRALLSTLSHMHTVAAWCCHDSGALLRSHWHFERAMTLATEANDGYGAAYAMRHAGMMLVDRGQANNALKIIQLGIVRLSDVPARDARVAVARSECRAVSALALSRMGHAHQALDELKAVHDGWTPPTEHVRGCMDLDSAHAYLHIGQLDTAQAMATTSAKTFRACGERREGVLADVAVARLHVHTGEPDGLKLARAAITQVAQTQSAVARECWLLPLADALGTRPGSDYQDLARMARQVASS